MRRYLKCAEDDAVRSRRFRRALLCPTLAGNACDLLTITAPTDDMEALRRRRGVVITGERGVHPPWGS